MSRVQGMFLDAYFAGLEMDEEHRAVLDEHSPSPQISLVFPMSHPPSHFLSSSLPSPSQPLKIGLRDQISQGSSVRWMSQSHHAVTLHHSISRDTKDWMTPGSTWFGLSFIRDLGVAVTFLWQSPSESKGNTLQ